LTLFARPPLAAGWRHIGGRLAALAASWRQVGNAAGKGACRERF